MEKVLILCGGGGPEHEISLLSAQFLKDCLNSLKGPKGLEVLYGEVGTGEILSPSLRDVDFVIPCFHGHPGETGDIPGLLDMLGIPYLGSGPEASRLCFNKISTKLWLSALGIPTTPYVFLKDEGEFPVVEQALAQWGEAFLKASSQGSSMGCFPITKSESREELKGKLHEAFKVSPYVLVEKFAKARELEVSCYSYEGMLLITPPGEIHVPGPSSFYSYYSYEEKYGKHSRTTTSVVAKDVDAGIVQAMHDYARRAFEGLKLRHLARVDFFLTDREEIFLSEINTFPGMASISLFPRMIEAQGHEMSLILEHIIRGELRGGAAGGGP